MDAGHTSAWFGLVRECVCSTRPPGRKCIRLPDLIWSGVGMGWDNARPLLCSGLPGAQTGETSRGERRRMIPNVLEKKKKGLSSWGDLGMSELTLLCEVPSG